MHSAITNRYSPPRASVFFSSPQRKQVIAHSSRNSAANATQIAQLVFTVSPRSISIRPSPACPP